MCGIYCSILSDSHCKSSEHNYLIENDLKAVLQNRGPNAFNIIQLENVIFGGFVLWQQGSTVSEQPIQSDNIVLLFNGDIFNIDNKKSRDCSDTEWLCSAIAKCKSDADICNLFRTLHGPFSLVFFNKCTNELFFGRDSLGRNSLIVEQHENELRILSTSFYCSETLHKAIEVPSVGLFKINVKEPSHCLLFPWSSTGITDIKIQIERFNTDLYINTIIGECIDPIWLTIGESKNTFNFYELCSDNESIDIFEKLLLNKALQKELSIFSTLLKNSVKTRVTKTPKYCGNCVLTKSQACKHAKIAILFSGGIDCSILAILANEFVDQNDPIDLINVCFEKINNKNNEDCWEAPDRLSALDSLKELQRICPKRKWNFIEVNVSREELQLQLSTHIKHLIYPLNTVLDESIGCAFWFASRGVGFCKRHESSTKARVVIVGSGADELFGGYTRHRNAYRHCKGGEIERQSSVLAELEKDWHRIPTRNLARDDRVVADNGKTLRAPFIEENIVQYVRSLNPTQRCCFTLKEGLGDKLFLRLYGYNEGLLSAALLKKRAIQFGSKIANKKQSANEKSEYLNFATQTIL